MLVVPNRLGVHRLFQLGVQNRRRTTLTKAGSVLLRRGGGFLCRHDEAGVRLVKVKVALAVAFLGLRLVGLWRLFVGLGWDRRYGFSLVTELVITAGVIVV